MLIVSNALTNVVDEGCVKVANSIVKRIKKCDEDAYVIAFDRQTDLADEFIKVNKLLLNRRLLSKVRKNKGAVTYIPFPAKSLSTAIRVFILSLFAGKNFRVILSMTAGVGLVGKLLFKLSRAKLIVFSKRSEDLYSGIVGSKNVIYLKSGVDTEKFTSVSRDEANELKEKFGVDTDRKLVLHVGHLNRGRNVQQLMKLSEKYQTLLVTSTQTKDEQDTELKNELLSRGVKVVDTYIPDIENIYRMADVYFFPVVDEGRCIDVPLSCMEAAACNKPIVTTDFGEMREFVGKDGFYFINSFDADELEAKIEAALGSENFDTRSAVLDYDWRFATEFLAKVKEYKVDDYDQKTT
jgi:glycosyltransferase involved in cell wall biosynthesis